VSSRPVDNPAPLLVAASLVAVEGLLMVILALVELGNLSSDRVTMGIATTAFFVLYGAVLMLCAWSVTHHRAWARSPIVLTQLIMLGLAWNFRDGGTVSIAIALAVVAVVVVAGILHPASIAALDDER
jgi:peptidoglycan/LPS O-acetylase OafA/YrhL